MIVTIGNTKGGVGKTTLAVQIAIARAQAGRDVWLIDGDRQGTAAAAIAARNEAERLPGIACAQYPEGPAMRPKSSSSGRSGTTSSLMWVGATRPRFVLP